MDRRSARRRRTRGRSRASANSRPRSRAGSEIGPLHLAICAEYDALPGIGHACGHNIIAATAVGAGLALAPLVDELGLTVTVIGTPAEEGGGGKVYLLDRGAFDGVHAAMMVHPAPLEDMIAARRARSSHFCGRATRATSRTPRPRPSSGINAGRRDHRSRRSRSVSCASICGRATRCTASSPTAATRPTSFPRTPKASGWRARATLDELAELAPARAPLLRGGRARDRRPTRHRTTSRPTTRRWSTTTSIVEVYRAERGTTSADPIRSTS